MRLCLALAVLAASALYMAHRLQGVDPAAVLAGLRALTMGQVALALGAVALAFIGVAGQERAISAHLALPLNPWRAGRAAVASAALSQTLGFGPIIGALVRRRLLPEITLVQSFAISAGITLGFFAGLGLFTLATWGLLPGLPQRGWAQAGLVAALALLVGLSLSRWPAGRGLRWPNLFVLARFLAWLALDLGALALGFWAVLPPGTGLAQVLPVFLLALGVGIASGSPGGLGPFEAVMLTWAPMADGPGLLAAILAFRTLAHALPAGLAALWTLAPRRAQAGGAQTAGEEIARLSAEALNDLPQAEAQLIRQGQLRLWVPGAGGFWLSARLAHTRVMIGSPMASAPGALIRAEAMARAEARLLCLYKIDARLAAAARARGHAVLPVAREAVVAPGAFHLSGPDKARLRRKLSHARKAGVVTEDCAAPPLAEMDEVAAAWANAHGRERGLTMGQWERSYAAGQRIFAARGATGQLLAFVTFHTTRGQWVLDLVRFRPEAPDGTIYALVVSALEAARWQEVAEVSLASVPEPGFGQAGWRGVLARRLTSGSEGLGQFKAAFAPQWRKRYVAAPGPLALVFGGLELARAILNPPPLARGRRALMVFTRRSSWAGGAGPPADVAAGGKDRAASDRAA